MHYVKKGYEITPTGQVAERAFLVGVSLPNSSIAKEQEYLDELEQLASTAGAIVVGKTIQGRTRIDGGTFIGKGKAEEIKETCQEFDVNLLIFDDDLTPAQSRNLEKILNLNVIDRTELILDIFARHAKTRQAKIQVELAQLTYALPRLTKLWDHLSRQVGGIGTRGPGETQLEVDRRRINTRMSHLKNDLKRIAKRKNTIRQSRDGLPMVAICGYTNAGKSTLMNALTGADTLVEDQLFATLDTTTRKLETSNNMPILMIDTVGFIRKLPHHLVVSFKATLDDIAQAQLILHVVDLSHPVFEEQMEIAEDTLRMIENIQGKTLNVFNKIDSVDKALVRAIAKRYPDALFISARDRTGLDEVKKEIEAHFFGKNLRVEVILPAGDGKSIALVRRLLHNAVGEFQGDSCILQGTIEGKHLKRLENMAEAEVRYLF